MESQTIHIIQLLCGPTLMDFGGKADGRFNEQTAAYKENPTLRNYLRLRREDADAEIEIGVIGGIEQLLFMEDELRKFGFDPSLVASTLDADENAISELSLQIIEKLLEAEDLASNGETHLVRRGLVIPDKLVDWLISGMLDSLSWNNHLFIPRDLIVLIRERLGGSVLHYEKASEAHHKRHNAIIVAAQIKASGIEPTFKDIAKAFDVAPSTVTRWFQNSAFEREVESWSRMFDTEGKLISVQEIRKLAK